mgnify:CR=1 FL=1|tara:strand:+ start:5 stop:1447 length:1443 start_codon:yes stop_codon:yes gene_type:complete
MVKLIRVHTNDDKLYFNNNIQSELTLPPQSQIGLLNCNFEKQLNEIVIKNGQTFKFALNDYDPDPSDIIETAEISRGTYNQVNIGDLIFSIASVLNNALTIDQPKAIGSAWDVNRTEYNNNLVIQTFQTPTKNIFVIGESQNIIQDSNNLIKDGGNDGDPDAFIFSSDNDPLTSFLPNEGCGIFRIQLGPEGIADKGQVFITLANEDAQIINDNFTSNKYNFGIFADDKFGKKYRYRNNTGAITNTAINIDWEKDFLEISCSGNKIEGRVYKETVTHLLFSENYETGVRLQPSIVIQTMGAGVIFDQMKFTDYNALNKLLPTEQRVTFNSALSAFDPPEQNFGTSDFYFEFPSLELAQFLGYEFQSDLLLDNNDFFSLAPNKINYFDQSECYIIELLNLSLDSYDGLKSEEKRKNILMVMQNVRNKSDQDFLFEASNVIFIDLNNAYPIPIRNLQLRIVDDEYNDVFAIGGSNITLLFNT